MAFFTRTPPLLHKISSDSPIYEVNFKNWHPFHLIKVRRTENFTSKYPPKCGQSGRMTIFSSKNTQLFSSQGQVLHRVCFYWPNPCPPLLYARVDCPCSQWTILSDFIAAFSGEKNHPDLFQILCHETGPEKKNSESPRKKALHCCLSMNAGTLNLADICMVVY